MTSDELQAWGEAISESFDHGEVYTVAQMPGGAIAPVSVAELEEQWDGISSGYDLDGNFVTFDFSGVADVSRPVLRRAPSHTVNAASAWSWAIPADGTDYWNYMPGFGRYDTVNGSNSRTLSAGAWGGGSPSANVSDFCSYNNSSLGGSYIGSGLVGSPQYTSVFSNVGFRVSRSYSDWKGWVGWYTTNIFYSQSAFDGELSMDAVIRPYQSWWGVSSSSSFDDITELFRHPPRAVSFILQNLHGGGYSYYSSGQEIDGGVYFWSEKQENGAWRVWFGDAEKTVLPLPFSASEAWKFGFSLQFGNTVTSIGCADRPSVYLNFNTWLNGSSGSSAFQKLSDTVYYGYSVVTVWNWDSGSVILTKGATLQDIYNALKGNTAEIAKQGGLIVGAVDALPDKFASGLTPSESDIQGGVSDVTSKFDASYGNTKSLFDMVENLYVTLKDGFAGASDVTSWDFPGIKVKLNGEVHTICPEMQVQKTDVGLQQYLTLVVRVILVVALIWMVWNKVHRVIVPKEADE